MRLSDGWARAVPFWSWHDAAVTPAATITAQAKALADATRFDIFERLRSSKGALLVVDLAETIPVHPNAIRGHLDVLIEARLVVREPVRRLGPGRPAWAYRVSPGAIERWGLTTPAEELASMLLEVLDSGASAKEVGERAGTRLHASTSGVPGSGPIEAVVGVARRLGYEPHRPRSRTGGLVEVSLSRCPCRGYPESQASIIKELHGAVLQQVCDAEGGGYVLQDLLLGPADAACRIVLAPTP